MKKPPSAGRGGVETPPASSRTPSSPLAPSRGPSEVGASRGLPPVYERLIALLSRYGSASMARIAVQQAMTTIYGSRAAASGAQVERVIEEAMSAFRVFCDESKRAQLWIDLVELCESERTRSGR